MSLPDACSAFVRLVTFRWWTWRITRRLLFACALLATLVAIFYAVENWRGRRAFAAAARDAAAAGVSFHLGDLAPPPVPDAQNLAKIRLLDAPRAKEDYDRFWEDLQDRLRPRSSDGAKIVRHLELSAPNTFRNLPADLASIQTEFQAAVGGDGNARLLRYLEDVAPILSELNEAAADRPQLRYDYEWDNFHAIPLRHLTALRSAARAASLQALFDLDNDRPAAAARSLLLPLRLGSALHSDPILITQLTASALGSSATNCLWQGMLHHQWTAAELDLFARHLAADNILAGFRQAYAVETAAAISISLRVAARDSGAFLEELLDSGSGRMLNDIFRLAPSGWVYQNAAEIERATIHEILPSIDLTAARVTVRKTAARHQNNRLRRPYHILAEILLPAFDGITIQAGQAKTTRDLARLAVALEQYRLARGAYPDSLIPVLAADPALAALHDPFTGEAYRYRRDVDGGFTLWGVGPNAHDDEAAFLPEKRPRNPYESATDLVWRVPGA